MLPLKDFPYILQDDKQWIPLDNIVDWIRQHETQTTGLNRSTFRKTIKRIFAGYKEQILYLEGKEFVTTFSLLKFIFSHSEKYHVCQGLARDVDSHVTKQSPTEKNDTVYDLYKCIAQWSTKNELDKNLEPYLDYPEEKISTLYSIHKEHFSESEWKWICAFEVQFGFTCDETEHPNPVIATKEKWDFYHACTQAATLGKTVKELSKKCIQRRNIRKNTSTAQRVKITGKQFHCPSVMDSDIGIAIDLRHPDFMTNVITVDHESSKQTNSIDVFIEVSTNTNISDSIGPVVSTVSAHLNKRHHVKCSNVLFLSPGSFDTYKSQDNISRFRMRDDLFQNKFQGSVLHVTSLNTSDLNETYEEEEDVDCTACFHSSELKPLSIKGFDIFHEWIYDVPLPVRLLLQPFINPASIRDSKDKTSFLRRKFEKAYSAYDTLLNVFSFKYAGILQQANTDELVMGYRSAETVFKVASSVGASQSLNYAENSLKKRSVDDDLYYEAFLKEYSLTYDTDAGRVTKGVRMRDCHIVFMLDNLVRLKFTEDPDRGDSRSKQMDTLPVTVQGLPRDSVVTNSWHDPDICDGSERCACKNDVKLTLDDVNQVLFEMSDAEEVAFKKFNKLCTWGVMSSFKDILQEAVQYPTTGHGMDAKEDCINCDNTIGAKENSINCEGDTGLQLENNIESQDVEIDNTGTSDDPDDYEEAALIKEVLHALEIVDSDQIYMDDQLDRELDSDDEDHSDFFGPHVLDDLGVSAIDHTTLGQASPIKMSLDYANDLSELEKSFEACTMNEADEANVQPLPVQFGFSKHIVPPLLYRHPPPYSGRDDDPAKLQEIADDLLRMQGYADKTSVNKDKILFGPDNKIGKNLLLLMENNAKYHIFLPEFPCLHLRKSRITILFSAYKNAGLLQLLQYMRDNNTPDWAKLITASNIDTATRNISRLSMALHIAFLLKFSESLPRLVKDDFVKDLAALNPNSMSSKWDESYRSFIKTASKTNATFALHVDMMTQMDAILAIKLAERLGGDEGYNLLLATSKSSLPFSFVNGATSYGPYCVQLLYEHFRAGPFNRKLKACLYSTPLKDGSVNMATDTKRELDHKDVTKGFRSGSTMGSVMRRMALVDSLNEVRDMRETKSANEDVDYLGWNTTSMDRKHVQPLVSLIMKRGGLSLTPADVPCNVYSKTQGLLSKSMLDKECQDVARYLIMKYVAKTGLFECDSKNIPDAESLSGPKELVSKAKSSKGVTVRRSGAKVQPVATTERQKKETTRQKIVGKETKVIDALSSDKNTCQALVKPDCSKRSVFKSKGMFDALATLLTDIARKEGAEVDDPCKYLESKNLIHVKKTSLTDEVVSSVSLATMEFAGVKFKGKLETLQQYHKRAENAYVYKTIHQLPKLKHFIICEEKYSFTPDSFKAATRNLRCAKREEGVGHLKSAAEMLKGKKLDITGSQEGKSVISTYLASNIQSLQIKKDIILDFDSELNIQGCSCDEKLKSRSTCECKPYAIPIRCLFNLDGSKEISDVTKIHQRKGEGEMSQVDWLINCSDELKPGEAAASIVTSGDIDSVVIHLFTLSTKWPRDIHGNFLHDVYVILQKPQRLLDVYNITAIIRMLEVQGKTTGTKVALALCLGGNDFIPKMQHISHTKILQLFTSDKQFGNLFRFEDTGITIDAALYQSFVKHLYCGKKYQTSLPFDEVRKLTMVKRCKTTTSVLVKSINDPDKWMPPASALDRMAELIDLQIQYLQTAGQHEAMLPNFLGSNCLIKSTTGEVEYDFGPDGKATSTEIAKITGTSATPKPKKNKGQKRLVNNTPQGGKNKKRFKQPAHSTPRK